jgi:ech hydrogenase subunit B
MIFKATLLIGGLIAAPLLGGLLVGLDRILTARLQSRIGPPLLQPFYDLVKLFQKERILVNIWQAFCVNCYVAAASISVGLFVLKTDLLLILFIQAVGAIFLVVGALTSTSPYSQVGAQRELFQILSYEPLLILAIIGIYLETGSFKVEAVLGWEEPLLIRLPFLFLVVGYALLVKLRKSPVDLSTSHHAHQELVKGLTTDYSGPYLALIELGHWYEIILFLCFCSLFWATNWIGMIIVAAAVYLIEILVDNTTARLTWRWMLSTTWGLGLTLSFINLIWLYLRR